MAEICPIAISSNRITLIFIIHFKFSLHIFYIFFYRFITIFPCLVKLWYNFSHCHFRSFDFNQLLNMVCNFWAWNTNNIIRTSSKSQLFCGSRKAINNLWCWCTNSQRIDKVRGIWDFLRLFCSFSFVKVLNDVFKKLLHK